MHLVGFILLIVFLLYVHIFSDDMLKRFIEERSETIFFLQTGVCAEVLYQRSLDRHLRFCVVHDQFHHSCQSLSYFLPTCLKILSPKLVLFSLLRWSWSSCVLLVCVTFLIYKIRTFVVPVYCPTVASAIIFTPSSICVHNCLTNMCVA